MFPGFLETFVTELRVSQFIEKGFNRFPNELILERFQEALQSQFIGKGFKKTELCEHNGILLLFLFILDHNCFRVKGTNHLKTF